MAATLFGDDTVGGEVGPQPFDDELLGRAVGFGDQVVLALQLKGDPAFEELRQQRSRLAGDSGCCLEEGTQASTS